MSDRGAPHVVHAEVTTGGGGLIAVVGAGTAHNAGQRPHGSVLCPCRRPNDDSLVVDVVATVAATPDGVRLHLAPRRREPSSTPGAGARSASVTVRVRLHPVTPGYHELIPRSWRLLRSRGTMHIVDLATAVGLHRPTALDRYRRSSEAP